jgi:hypothetical protein
MLAVMAVFIMKLTSENREVNISQKIIKNYSLKELETHRNGPFESKLKKNWFTRKTFNTQHTTL